MLLPVVSCCIGDGDGVDADWEDFGGFVPPQAGKLNVIVSARNRDTIVFMEVPLSNRLQRYEAHPRGSAFHSCRESAEQNQQAPSSASVLSRPTPEG